MEPAPPELAAAAGDRQEPVRAATLLAQAEQVAAADPAAIIPT